MLDCIDYTDIPLALRGKMSKRAGQLINLHVYRSPRQATLAKFVYDWCRENGITYIKKVTTVQYCSSNGSLTQGYKKLELEFDDERQAELFRLRWLV